MRALLATLLAAAPALRGQTLVLSDTSGHAAAIVREVAARPHILVGGRGALVYPRDSTISSSLIVLGRPTYLASRVIGDVVVVGGDLFLRPGVDVAGRAVSIGGTVARTTLGRVGGVVESLPDDRFGIAESDGRYTLTRQAEANDAKPAMFQLAGFHGVKIPTYERVSGLSLPVAGLVVLGRNAVEIEPSVTYRSRLGVFDPAVALRVGPEKPLSFEARVGRETRTNDAWIYSDLVNSALTLLTGRDARNYFRSRIGEARVLGRVERGTLIVEPYAGARVERVTPITAAGNVWSATGRKSEEKIRRPNPLVEAGDIRSGLVGSKLTYSAGDVTGRLSAGVEQSFAHPAGTTDFTQVTLDGRVEFPTFSTQRLAVQGHAVTTRGDLVPRARYAYLGGSGTLPVMELLEQGGAQLVFVESRYSIPIDRIQLPVVGAPVVTLRHLMGAAGPQSLPSLEQEIGVSLGLSALHLDVTTDVSGRRGSKVGVGISLSR